MDYFSSIGMTTGDSRQLLHAWLQGLFGRVIVKPQSSNHLHMYLCQFLDTDGGLSTQPLSPSAHRRTRPVLAKVSVTAISHNITRWNPVTCPSGQSTHTFLACDVITFCWVKSDVTFSRRPDSWAFPASKSCPVPLTVTSRPPSYTCQSKEQHVPYSLVCDHRSDCLDGSDETFCTVLPCQHLSQFQCRNKQV